jgi:uncharacterized protein (DUF3084 family)
MNLYPLPLEKELRIERIKRSLNELPREELLKSLAQAIEVLTRMTHQTKQLRDRVEELEVYFESL